MSTPADLVEPQDPAEPTTPAAPWAPGKRAEYGGDLGVEPRHAADWDEVTSRLQVEYWAAMAETARGSARLAASLRAV